MIETNRRELLAAALGASSTASAAGFPARWTSAYRVDRRFPYHLTNAEGRQLFLLNKTAWAYFGCRKPDAFLRRARQQGITVIRVALEGRPYFQQLGLDLWPWAGNRENPVWGKFNEPYWREVERRILLAGQAGIGIDLVLYFTLHPEERDYKLQLPYLKRAIHRLGRYPNVVTWEVANEYLKNERFQDQAGEFLAAHDPLGRPVCTSDGTTDDAAWPQKAWVGLAVVHTCTGSTPDWPLDEWYQSVARNVRGHGKPAFNNETGRERRHRNDDPVHRRKQSWIWCCSGAYWTYHSWEGCEGIDDEEYRGPGAEFLRPLSDIFETLPFGRMNPNSTALQAGGENVIVAALATPGREEVAAYLCTSQSGSRQEALEAQLRLPAGKYEIRFVSPSDGSQAGSVGVESKGLGRRIDLSVPGFTDDILIRSIRIQAGVPSRIAGSG